MKFTIKKSVTTISMFGCLTMAFMSFGQEGENLVPNPSFESLDGKVRRLGAIASAKGWSSPTGARADLFVSSKVPDVNVPDNIYGTEEPKEGGNYAGIVAYSYGNKVPRSYLFAKLDAPMKKGMTYCVKFNVSLAEASKYACNNIGALFTKKQLGAMDSKLPIIEEPSVVHFNNSMNIMSARYNWSEVCGVYIAKGGEKYITLGNFMSDDDTKSERMKPIKGVKVKQVIAAYYYIDDVSVQLLDSDKGEKCECAVEEAGDSYSTTIYQQVFNITPDMTPAQKIEMQQVFFAFGREKMNSEGEESLDMIADLMKADPSMTLEIIGHNNAMEDEVGEEKDFYRDMDSKRVAAVMLYLKDKGIAENRMILSLRGSNEPNPEVTAEDMAEDEDVSLAKSRRVTFKVR